MYTGVLGFWVLGFWWFSPLGRRLLGFWGFGFWLNVRRTLPRYIKCLVFALCYPNPELDTVICPHNRYKALSFYSGLFRFPLVPYSGVLGPIRSCPLSQGEIWLGLASEYFRRFFLQDFFPDLLLEIFILYFTTRKLFRFDQIFEQPRIFI